MSDTVKINWFSTALFFLLAAMGFGCSKSTPTESAAPTPSPMSALEPSPQALVVRSITKSDWLGSIKGAYSVRGFKEEGDGVTSFVACFGGVGKDCGTMAFGKYDAFRKVSHYTPAGSQLGQHLPVYLQTYIALPDCAEPIFVLRARYFSQGGWIFLNRVSILADGELLLDHLLPALEVKKEVLPGGIEERVTVVATSAQLEALRKIVTAKKTSVRLTGDKGYSMLKEGDSVQFRKDTAEALLIFDRLAEASKGKLPVSCQ